MERIFGNTAIYWINLDRSVDRREHMTKQLKGTNNYRIQAIDGTDKNKYPKEYKIINPNPSFSNSLNAVVSSHMKAIFLAKTKQLDNVIIIEDKCHFEYIDLCKHTIQNMIEIMDKQDELWDAVQLSSVRADNKYDDYLKNNFQITKWCINQYGCNYLINKRGIDKMLKLIPTDGEKVFDYTAVTKQPNPELIILGNLNSYSINYPLFYVYWNKSTFNQYYKNDNMIIKNNSLRSLTENKKNVHEFFKKITRKN